MTPSSGRFRPGEHLESEVFVGLDLTDAAIDGVSFERCTFERCVALRASFRRCGFDECRFVGCDLSMAQLHDARLRDVRFEGTKLMGVDWSVVQGFGLELAFQECELSYGKFSGLSLRDLRCISSRGQESDFSGADLTGADFDGTNLSGALFRRTNLTRADLSGATNVRVDPQANTLKKTRLSLDSLLAIGEALGVVVPGMRADR